MSSVAWLIKYKATDLSREDMDWVYDNLKPQYTGVSGSIHTIYEDELPKDAPEAVKKLVAEADDGYVDIQIVW